MKYILALDQGTTSSRAIIFDKEGNIKAVSQKEFRQFFPYPSLVEHDADEIWNTQLSVAKAAMRKANLCSSDIAAIGITNQRETTLIWDRQTGHPIHNAIVWQDRRTAPFCERLRTQGLESIFNYKTGLLIDPYFSGTKIRWLLDNVPSARKRAERGELAFGTIDTWLVYNLTGGKQHITDRSNASRTLLYNIHTHEWDEELLDIFQIPYDLLPKVCSSSEVYGETAAEIFGACIPIAGIAGDQQAATFGQACMKQGMAKNTYGTGCFVLLNTGAKAVTSHNKLLTTVAWQINQRTTYALEGSILVAGAVVQWLRDGIGILHSSNDVEALAASVTNNGGVYFVPAFVGLGAPYWDSYARGSIYGLTRGSTSAHIARAALESIAYQTADVLTAMQKDAGCLAELRVDGKASKNNLLMQFQADVLGVPVVRPKITETTSLGAAYLAGLAIGYWENETQIAQQWQEDHRFEPQLHPSEREQLLDNWHRAVERSAHWEGSTTSE